MEIGEHPDKKYLLNTYSVHSIICYIRPPVLLLAYNVEELSLIC